MIIRQLWQTRIENLWTLAPIVWLAGVRRTGKTTLARQFKDSIYVNCDLPGSARWLEDPETFFSSLKTPILVLDEVHQLADPSRLLKIGADLYRHIKILATGSSTLEATRKFKDTLTGRKRILRFVPVLAEEMEAFGAADFPTRLLRGGLPEALMTPAPDRGFYSEWLDSYYARDIAELFNIGKRHAFLTMSETLLRNSGGLFEATGVSRECGLSRPTVQTYLDAMAVTQFVHILKPFHGGGGQELVRQPKVYGFDTGFVCHCRGWDTLRPNDCGKLWEHLVLETLVSIGSVYRVHFWRDKTGREVDFVIPVPGGTAWAIEAKWSPDSFEPGHLAAFRKLYPLGRNLVVTAQRVPVHTKRFGDLEVSFVPIGELRREFSSGQGGNDSVNL